MNIAYEWIHAVLAGLTGAVGIKLLDIAHQEYRDRRKESATAEQVLIRHIDPILKAAVELVGKIRSLAAHDFKELIELRNSASRGDGSVEVTNVLFLHAQFWSRIQILRQESLFVNLAKSPVGKKLVAFIETLESRGVRIADRAYQRGMGESLLGARNDSLASITYFEFVDRYVTSAQMRSWFQPLTDRISRVEGSQARQSFLVYATVVHALIDTLDPTHLTDRERPGFPNKLTRKNRQLLKYQVFGIYLKFVEAADKYFEATGEHL